MCVCFPMFLIVLLVESEKYSFLTLPVTFPTGMDQRGQLGEAEIARFLEDEEDDRDISIDDDDRDPDYIPHAPPPDEELMEFEEEVVVAEAAVGGEIEVTTTAARKKKHLVDPTQWKVNLNRFKKEKGLAHQVYGYHSTKTWTDRPEKKLSPRCDCKGRYTKCSEVPEDMRKKSFTYFWNLSWEAKMELSLIHI